MRRLLILLLFLCWSMGAASFTEFYVQPTGNNLNAGSTTDDAPIYTAAGGFWTNATGVWRKDGETLTGVTSGMWASVYPDATTVNPVFIGRITNVTTTNIWISLTAKGGTSPVDDFAGATTIRVGGAWAGPNTNQNPSCQHPFNFVANTMTNTSGNVPCVNIKVGTYSTTNAITAANVGPIVWAGYETTLRDNAARPTIDGTWAGTSYNLFSAGAQGNTFMNLVVANNGATTAGAYVISTVAKTLWYRCSAKGGRRTGWYVNGGGCTLVSCESYNNNSANSAGYGGFELTGNTILLNCISYSNTTANSIGFLVGGTDVLQNCVAYANGNDGFQFSGNFSAFIKNCDSYGNGGDGFDFTYSSTFMLNMINCNAIKNTLYGINSSGGSQRLGCMLNTGFGSGTATNSSGSFGPNMSAALNGVNVVGSITYAANETPWSNPTNGNFSISLSTSKSAGYGLFTQSTVNSPTNTVSFPDIGAAQSASTNSASAGGAYTWAQ